MSNLSQQVQPDPSDGAGGSLPVTAEDYRAALTVLRTLLEHEDVSIRGSAVRALGQAVAIPEETVIALLEAVHSGDVAVQTAAVESLGWLGADAAVAALLSLARDMNADVRRQAIQALGESRSDEDRVVKALLNALNDPDPDIRPVAVRALGETGSNEPAVVSALLDALNDQEAEVRIHAAGVLHRVGYGSNRVVASLREALGDADAGVRVNAAQSLLWIDNTDEVAANTLRDALQDADRSIRAQAAEALGRFGAVPTVEDVVQDLMEVLGDEDAAVRANAVRALGNVGTGSPDVVSAIERLLSDEDSGVRWEAVHALGQLGRRATSSREAGAVLDTLRTRLEDPDPNARLEVAQALIETGAKEGREAALATLKGLLTDETMRSGAIWALSRAGEAAREAAAVLSELLHDAEPSVRVDAAWALVELGVADEQVASMLHEALEDEDPYVRIRSADALGRLDAASTAAVEALRRLLDHEDPNVRLIAAQTICSNAETGFAEAPEPAAEPEPEPEPKESVPEPAVEDPVLVEQATMLRYALAEALAWLGDVEAVDHLLRSGTRRPGGGPPAGGAAHWEPDPWRADQVWLVLVRVLADGGELDEAERIADRIQEPAFRTEALAALGRALAGAGRPHAEFVFAEAESTLRSVVGGGATDEARLALVQALAAAAHRLTDESGALDMLSDRKRLDRAEMLARSFSRPDFRARALAAVAEAVAKESERAERAAGFLQEARAAALETSLSNGAARAIALAEVGDAHLSIQDAEALSLLDNAVTAARSLNDPLQMGAAYLAVAGAFVSAGEDEQADDLYDALYAVAIDHLDPATEVDLLSRLALELHGSGRYERARRAFDRAVRLAHAELEAEREGLGRLAYAFPDLVVRLTRAADRRAVEVLGRPRGWHEAFEDALPGDLLDALGRRLAGQAAGGGLGTRRLDVNENPGPAVGEAQRAAEPAPTGSALDQKLEEGGDGLSGRGGTEARRGRPPAEQAETPSSDGASPASSRADQPSADSIDAPSPISPAAAARVAASPAVAAGPIVVQKTAERYEPAQGERRVRIEVSERTVELTFEGKTWESPNRIDGIELLGLRLRPRAYGQRLFDMIIHEEAFENDARTRATLFGFGRAGDAARIELHVKQGAEALHEIRWEYLWPTIGPHDVPLSLMERSPFYRWIPNVRDVTPVEAHPLKVLVVIASPPCLDRAEGCPGVPELPPLDQGLERDIAEQALERLERDGGAEYTILDGRDATLDGLREALEDGYHVLHVLGHGIFAEGGYHLVMEQGSGPAARPPLVSAGAFVNTLRAGPGSLQLVVLDSCQSANDGEESALGGLGRVLVREGVPAVIAMQAYMPFDAAQFFTQHFYDDLARSGRVDMAMAATRLAMHQTLGADHQAWGYPVLMLAEGSDGRLFDVETAWADAAPEQAIDIKDYRSQVVDLARRRLARDASARARALGLSSEVQAQLGRALGETFELSLAGAPVTLRVASESAVRPTRAIEDFEAQDRAGLGVRLRTLVRIDPAALHTFVREHTRMELQPGLFRHVAAALNTGKHVVFIGPPGTGKTSLAQAVCAYARTHGVAAGMTPTTATADWTTFDTVGGYVPDERQALRFQPGLFLQSIREGTWLVIDEINRAEIDKAFGSLFTLLSGQQVDLPYRAGTQRLRILPAADDDPDAWIPADARPSDFVVHPNWRILATMNVYDRSSLFAISLAFMRRFAFIDVDLPGPALYRDLIERWLADYGLGPADDGDAALRDVLRDSLAGLLDPDRTLSQKRALGPAIVRDMIRFVGACRSGRPAGEAADEEAADEEAADEEADALRAWLAEAFLVYAVPQLEGLDRPAIQAIYDEVQDPFFKDTPKAAVRMVLARIRALYPHVQFA